MARGTVVGETPHSQANNAAYDEGYPRIFGDRSPQRGKWYADPKTGQLLDEPPAFEPTDGGRVPVFTDRYMEGVQAPDGTDIGSRRKRRVYMREHGLVDYDDCRNYVGEVKKRRAAEHDRDLARDVEETARYLHTTRRR